jgi:CRISPR-associated endonuclease/helicase Cas3
MLADSFTILTNLIRDLVNADDGLGASEIAERYAITRRLVPKYIGILEGAGVPIYVDRRRYFVDETYRQAFTLTALESEILYLALEWSILHSVRNWHSLGALIRKLGSKMQADVAEYLEASLESGRTTDERESCFVMLTRLKRERREAEIDYLPLQREQESNWTVRPYWFTRNPLSDGIYLICDGTRDGTNFIPLTLKIDRIQRVTPTDSLFDPPTPEVLVERLKHSWGIWGSQDQLQCVELRFHPRHHQRLLESTWHMSQTIQVEDNGHVLFRAEVAEPREMVPWIRSWGSGVEVLSPLSLRQHIITSLYRQIQLYGLDTGSGHNDPLAYLWAKSDRRTGEYHLLIYHLIDVTAVASVMWHEALGEASRLRIRTLLSTSDDNAMRFFALLAGLHDIGKATVAFQKKVAERWDTLLLNTELEDDSRAQSDQHGTASARILARLLPEHFPNLKRHSWMIASAIGGHHGRWISADQLSVDDLSKASWMSQQTRLFDILVALTGVSEITLPTEEPSLNALCSYLPGFVSVCDWIGSDSNYFPFVSYLMDFEDYMGVAMGQAREALASNGWLGWANPRSALAFEQVFPFEPNPLQKAIVDALAANKKPIRLMIIEYPTGSGKTEAAVYAADQIVNNLGLSGIYIAMPTTATSNQMFERFSAFLGQRYPQQNINLHLVHGKARRNTRYLSFRTAASTAGDENRIAAATWFANRKRTLLAPFGVGTVDQAMVSVLTVRHHFVRSFALSDKVIIFDEVHAYDTYMQTIIQRLMEWLTVSNSPIILLSATLPYQIRSELVRACGGDLAALPDVEYPRLTMLYQDGEVYTLPIPGPPDRRVALQFVSVDLDELLAHVVNAYTAGGCIAVLCNTVNEATRVARALRLHDAVNPDDVDLFHARFPETWRADIETDVLLRFGKDSTRPLRAILVATQIIEQSLDLDFDLMVTQVAPIDLLIQRMGRLHRHERSYRPMHLSEPTLIVRVPEPEDPIDFGPSKYVYDRYILLKTYRLLIGLDCITVPQDMDRLIEEVYSGKDTQTDDFLDGQIESARAAFEKEIQEDRYSAARNRIRSPYDEDVLTANYDALPDDTDDPRFPIRTRDIEPGIDIVCVHELNGWLSLEPDTQLPVNIDRVPEGRALDDLLDRRITVRNRTYLGALLKSAPVPAAWQKQAILKHSRLVVFTDGMYTIPDSGLRLRLTRECGLEFLKEEDA